MSSNKKKVKDYLQDRGVRLGFDDLRKLRKARGYTQKEVAEIINSDQQTISKHERGLVVPETEFVVAYANLYCVSLEEIIFGKN